MVKITVVAYTDKVIAKKVLHDVKKAKELVKKWKKKYGTAVAMEVESD